MTSFERIMATMSGAPTDRPAATLTLSLYGARLLDCPLPEYYTNSAYYVEGQSAVWETFHPDLLFTPFVFAAIGAAFGSTLRYLPNYPPNLTKPAVTSAEEALRLPLPDVNSDPSLCYFRDATRGLVQRYGGEVGIVGVMPLPADLPALIMGLENWLETLLFQPTQAQQLLARSGEFFLQWAQAYAADGVDLIVMPSVSCQPRILPRKFIDTLIMPLLEELFPQVTLPLALHHGGDVQIPALNVLTTLPNVVAFVPDARDDLRTVRDLIGEKRALLGNLDGPTLAMQTPAAVMQTCREIVANRCADRRFIFATSGPDVAYATPPETIYAIMQMVTHGEG